MMTLKSALTVLFVIGDVGDKQLTGSVLLSSMRKKSLASPSKRWLRLSGSLRLKAQRRRAHGGADVKEGEVAEGGHGWGLTLRKKDIQSSSFLLFSSNHHREGVRQCH